MHGADGRADEERRAMNLTPSAGPPPADELPAEGRLT
jgi:hypothetical protein